MPLLNGCDFAFPPGDITIEAFYQALYGKGVRCAQRYLWDGGKGVTGREIEAARNAGPDGIRLAYGYEAWADSWRGGASAGRAHRLEAARLASTLGLGHDEPVYYAVDEDAAGYGMLGVAVDYVNAADDPQGHPSRGYGQYALAEALRRPTFQASAWSWDYDNNRPRISRYAALYQWHNSQPLAGGIVDLCEIRDRAALGITQEDGMAGMTPAEFVALLRDPHVMDAVADAVGPRVRNIVDSYLGGHSIQTSDTGLENNVLERIKAVIAGKPDPGHADHPKPHA